MSFAWATWAIITKCNSIPDAIEQPVSPGFVWVVDELPLKLRVSWGVRARWISRTFGTHFARVLTLAAWVPTGGICNGSCMGNSSPESSYLLLLWWQCLGSYLQLPPWLGYDSYSYYSLAFSCNHFLSVCMFMYKCLLINAHICQHC